VARAEHKRKYPDYRFVRGARNPKSSVKDKPPAKFVNTIAVANSPAGEDNGESHLTTTVSAPVNNKARRRTANKATEDPLRCEQIARLLVAGHKGSELEAIVQQLDAESARKKEEPEEVQFPQPIQPLPERVSHPSIARAQAIRRTSSCPPLDIASALVSKTVQAPSRRQKATRNGTMPYPTSAVKQARSVSPCITPSHRDSFDLTAVPSPVEGVFANQNFSFSALGLTSPTSAEGISPHDTTFYDVSSPVSATSTSYLWSPEPSPAMTHSYNMYGTSLDIPRAYPMQSSLSSSSSCSDLSTFSQPGKDSWASDFDNWLPSTDDEVGPCGAPATPDGHSPSIPLQQLTPLLTSPYQPEVAGMPKPALDLNNYAKGLEFFNQPTAPFYLGGIPTPEPEYYATQDLTNSSPYDMPLAHVSPINAGAPWQYQTYHY
jgi:hypothetical protein